MKNWALGYGASVSPVGLEPITNISATLGAFRYGRFDPTTRVSAGEFWRATYTPDGPATVHIWWSAGAVDAESWGDGGAWILERVPQMIGAGDGGFDCPDDAIRR